MPKRKADLVVRAWRGPWTYACGEGGVCVSAGATSEERESTRLACALAVSMAVSILSVRPQHLPLVRPSSPSARAVCLFVTAPTGGSVAPSPLHQSISSPEETKEGLVGLQE